MSGRLKAYLVTKISSIYQTTKSEIEKEQRNAKNAWEAQGLSCD
jgi:hypothetical protein